MNFYKRFIGDIQAKTGHLSLAEFGAYDRLLDHCYSTEQPLPADLDACCRVARAMSKEERKAVESVLAQFFTLTESGYTQGRVLEMLAEAQPKIEANKRNGKLGGRPKKNPTQTQEKPNGFSNGTQIKPNENLSQSQSQSITSTSNTLGTPATPGVCEQAPTKAGEVCKALKAAGMSSVSPSHPELLALIERGVSVETFTAAATDAVNKGKGFAYMLGIVKGQLASAASIAGLQAVQQADPDSRAAIEAEGQAKGFGRWDETKEQWHTYKARVRGNKPPAVDPGVAALVSGAIKTTRATA